MPHPDAGSKLSKKERYFLSQMNDQDLWEQEPHPSTSFLSSMLCECVDLSCLATLLPVFQQRAAAAGLLPQASAKQQHATRITNPDRRAPRPDPTAAFRQRGKGSCFSFGLGSVVLNVKVKHVIDLLEAEVVGPQVKPRRSKLLHRLQKSAARMPLMQLAGCCMQQLPDSVTAALVQLKLQMPPPQVVAGCAGRSVPVKS